MYIFHHSFITMVTYVCSHRFLPEVCLPSLILVPILPTGYCFEHSPSKWEDAEREARYDGELVLH